MEKWQAGEDLAAPRRKVERNIDAFGDLMVDKVEATRGRILAKRLLPIVRAAGYEGSGRNFRRLVAEVKADWRRQHRVFRPWVHAPGEHLVIDWAEDGRWKLFCAVLGVVGNRNCRQQVRSISDVMPQWRETRQRAAASLDHINK